MSLDDEIQSLDDHVNSIANASSFSDALLMSHMNHLQYEMANYMCAHESEVSSELNDLIIRISTLSAVLYTRFRNNGSLSS